jgi:AraC-like DNA-binding protein
MSAAWVYQEARPPAALASHVRRLWTEAVGDRPDDPGARVLPDGCIDLVWIAERPPFVAGPATRPVLTSAQPGGIVVGVRLQPGMASSLLGVPASTLLDAEVPFADLWGRALPEPLARVEESSSADDRLAALEALIVSRLEHGGPGDELIAAAAQWLARHPDGSLGRLHDLSGLSERQLRRRFEAAIGYGPKTFQRIVRFQRWLRLATSAEPAALSLSDLAAAAGYADQAHLTRESTRLAGLPPGALLGG